MEGWVPLHPLLFVFKVGYRLLIAVVGVLLSTTKAVIEKTFYFPIYLLRHVLLLSRLTSAVVRQVILSAYFSYVAVVRYWEGYVIFVLLRAVYSGIRISL